MFELTIPQPVANIIGILNSHGYEAYAVGGCVRDALMGREPEDWDITTSARPEDVKSLFHRTVDTGIKHGTVTVIMKGKGYEVTTYRIDGIYEDNRHPKEVTFTSDLLEDLKRRDFTINAMAYSPSEGLVDAFGGMDDLDKKVIRCVGEPMERFNEDALRILRAIRFSAQLNFAIDPATYKAIGIIAPNIANISKERIQAELTKLLLSDHPGKISEVYETGIAGYISSAFAAIDYKSCDIPISLPAVKYIRWAAFLRPASQKTDGGNLKDSGYAEQEQMQNPDADRKIPDNSNEASDMAGQAEVILRDLKFDNETIHNVKTLVAWSGRDIAPDAASVRKAMSQMSPDLWDALILLNNYSDSIKQFTREIRARGDCLSLKDLAVTGQDLQDAGIKPGREMGRILDEMLQKVLEDPDRNNSEYLLGTLIS